MLEVIGLFIALEALLVAGVFYILRNGGKVGE